MSLPVPEGLLRPPSTTLPPDGREKGNQKPGVSSTPGFVFAQEVTVGFEPTHRGFADPWAIRTPEDQSRISRIDEGRLPSPAIQFGMAESYVHVRASDPGHQR